MKKLAPLFFFLAFAALGITFAVYNSPPPNENNPENQGAFIKDGGGKKGDKDGVGLEPPKIIQNANVSSRELKDTKLAKGEDLGGKKRYATHVSTDKPIYRLGEMVRIRAVLLEAHNQRPLKLNQRVWGRVKIYGPRGQIVKKGRMNAFRSSGGFQWKIPAGKAGGEYRCVVNYRGKIYAPGERKFEIRAYRAPQLKSDIEFLKKGYGPGEKVTAALSTKRAAGGIPAGAEVTAIARVDGEEIFRKGAKLDKKGHLSVQFKLPEKMDKGEGTLAFVIKDGGVSETASKTIPILLHNIALKFYPEGGDLVAGLKSRVYFSARDGRKKPADITGVLISGDDTVVTSFSTDHEGRGHFSFTPEAKKEYRVEIKKPLGIKKGYSLPKIHSQGATLTSLSDSYKYGDKIELGLASTREETLTVTLRKKEKVLSENKVKVKEKQRVTLALVPEFKAQGILIATVWSEEGKPLAERLIFRRPQKSLKVKITTDKKTYTPGDRVKLTVQTLDSTGEPTPSVVGITVTNDSVLKMIEKRDRAPRLPAMAYLESDVLELKDSHLYLDWSQAKAGEALDLLLGCQGWRRFAFLTHKEFLKKYKSRASRVLAYDHKSKGRILAMNRKFEGEDDREALPPRPDVKAKPEMEKAKKKAPAQQPKAGGLKDRDDRAVRAKKNVMGKKVAREALRKEGARSLRPQSYFRVYAHRNRGGKKGQRKDFTETLYWCSGLKTDKKGQRTVSFDLSDSIAGFKVQVDGFTKKGVLGQGSHLIKSVRPFYISPKMPLEVTAGDEIQLPVALVNNTERDFGEVVLKARCKGEVKISEVTPFLLKKGERTRKIITLKVGETAGKFKLKISAKADGDYSDTVVKKLKVVPYGFPVEYAYSGRLKREEKRTFAIEIPEKVVPGSMKARAQVYPTPLANMTAALKRLIRAPHGCFEQTSSTNYPLVMAQQYFQSHSGVDPALMAKTKRLLDKGYKRLMRFECSKGGFEWFGKNPGHEALTAYGLLEFSDMAQVYPVDEEMVARTRKWLLNQRDGEGGFTRRRRALHTWKKAPEVSNSYICWALLRSGIEAETLKREIDHLARLSDTKNSYVLALCANVFYLAGREDTARDLMKRLAARQDKKGQITGATQSIVGSRGRSLQVETTSLALLAWMKGKGYDNQIEKAIQWLSKQCQGGRFGNTQATILALDAINTYDRLQAAPKKPGTVTLVIDGKSVGQINFDAESKGILELPAFGHALTAGKHEVEIKMKEGSSMPFSLLVQYKTPKPVSAEKAELKVDVKLSHEKIAEGEPLEAKVKVENTSQEAVSTPVAIVGLPGGVEPRHEQLKELVKKEVIAAYEVKGREIILYWRGIKGQGQKEFSLSLTAALPGTYQGPASRIYPYYAEEFKYWTGGESITITPQK